MYSEKFRKRMKKYVLCIKRDLELNQIFLG